MIALSVVSHGQQAIALEFLRSVARLKPASVARIVYTCNLPEPAFTAPDLGHIRLDIVQNREPKGFGANHNAAFGRCSEPYFCVVNPDIVLVADPFDELLAGFSEPSLGLVAPVVTSPSGEVENTARRLYTPSELLRQKLLPSNHGSRPDWLAGMFMLFRSEAFRAVAGFDEGYHLYIEDVDICTRLRVGGWTLRQVPGASVIHNARKESHRSPRYMRWHIAGMLRYWRSPSFWQYRSQLRREAARTPATKSAPPA